MTNRIEVRADRKRGAVIVRRDNRRAELTPLEAVELAARLLAAARLFPPFDRLPSSRSFEEIDESWQRTTQAIVSDDPDALRVRMAELDAESGIPVLAALLPSASPLHEPLNGFDLDHGS